MNKYLTPVAAAVIFSTLAFFVTRYLQASALYTTSACAIAGLGGAVCGYLLQSKPLFSSGFYFFTAAFCGIAFLGVDQTPWDENRQQLWKIAYAALGGLCLIGAFYKAWKKE